jgi:hypothetical protein
MHTLKPRLLECLTIIWLTVTIRFYFQWREWGEGEAVGFGPAPPQQSSQLQSSVQNSRPDQYGEAILTKPEGWEKFGFYRMREHFDCKRDLVKPIPTLEDWEYLRSKYNEIVDKHAVFNDPVPPTEGYTMDGNGPPPYYAAHGTRGRGVFASRDIKKGELVQDGSRSDVAFPGAEAWRRYVFSLPKHWACDFLAWTWTQKKSRNGKYEIFSAMNISVLFNGGAKASHEVNVGPRSSISSRFFALRDIKKGEELLYDYGVYATVWNAVGLGGK